MKGKLPKQCEKCRAIITIEDKKEVKEELIDGRRRLSFVCVVCSEENEISRDRVIPKEIRRFSIND